MEKLLEIPLIDRKWRFLAFALFPTPFLLLIALKWFEADLNYDSFGTIMYSSWILALSLLINLRRKEEDELTEKLRLIAFQRGVFFLMSGIVAIIMIQLIRFGQLSRDFISVFEALLLLMVYIHVTFHYLLWKINQD